MDRAEVSEDQQRQQNAGAFPGRKGLGHERHRQKAYPGEPTFGEPYAEGCTQAEQGRHESALGAGLPLLGARRSVNRGNSAQKGRVLRIPIACRLQALTHCTRVGKGFNRVSQVVVSRAFARQ